MAIDQHLKDKIKSEIFRLISERIQTSQRAIDSAIESKNNESKSSVGDKYETGRAMMQLEEEKYKRQLHQNYELLELFNKISFRNRSERVSLGSLVELSERFFFIGVGLGKIVVDDAVIYAISSPSPLGQELLHKSIGDVILLRGNEYTIKDFL